MSAGSAVLGAISLAAGLSGDSVILHAFDVDCLAARPIAEALSGLVGRVVCLIVVVLIIAWVAAAKTELSDRARRATKADVERARKEGRLPPNP